MNCKWDWIPVTERLPEFDESTKLYPLVLVSLRDGRVGTGCYRDDDERWCWRMRTALISWIISRQARLLLGCQCQTRIWNRSSKAEREGRLAWIHGNDR